MAVEVATILSTSDQLPRYDLMIGLNSSGEVGIRTTN